MMFRQSVLLTALMMVASSAVAKEAQELMWDDMIPKVAAPAKSALPTPDSGIGSAGNADVLEFEDPFADWDFNRPVESLDGKYVKIPGFIVPLESDEGGLLDEFLLVPYYGACIHTPPPAPNQVVYITLDEPFNLKSMYDAFWITGTIKTQNYSSLVADTVYRMEADKVELYEW